MKYQILSYQVVLATGERDTIKIPQHLQTKIDDLENFRKEKKLQHSECLCVNLTYIEHEVD